MASLFNHQSDIQNVPLQAQVITISKRYKQWDDIYNTNPIVREVFDGLSSHGYPFGIRRREIFSTNNVEKRIIKALIWAYPKGKRGNGLSRAVDNLICIANILRVYMGKDLPQKEYNNLCKVLRKIDGISFGVLGLLLYYFKIKCNGRYSIAITGHVRNAYQQFVELQGYSNRLYHIQLEHLNSLATQMNVTAEQLEFYLFTISQNKIQLN